MNESEIAAAVAAIELEDQMLQPEWSYLILSIVPLVCILGNLMVVAAVWTTRSLQTPTNHLLVSLAMADLIVGAFVMPFSIYLSINGLHWHLPLFVCYFYCVLDVAASTSSIIHLVLISIDRLVAATKPAEYKTVKHRKRVYLAIAITWVFSIALSLPLGTGFNTRTSHFLVIEHHCGIYNPIYMLGSSIFAFYLPCLIMIFTYGYIFYTLRKRLRAIQLQEMAGGQFLGFGADVGNITTSAIQSVIGIAPKNRNMITWEKPLLKKIEETAAEHASSLNDSEREQLQTILEAVHPSSSGSQENTTIEEDPDRPPSVLLEAVTLKCEIDTSGPILELPRPTYTKNMSRRFSDAVNSISSRGRMKSVSFGTASRKRRHSHQPQGNREVVTSEESKKLHSLKPPLVEKRKMRRLSEMISDWERPSRSSISNMYLYARRESVYIARKKLAGLKDWALDLLAKLKSKQGMAIRRETRATKLVATVMVVFLVCWLPFFTLNMIKIYKLIFNVWSTDMEIWFHWFTALGYLNSSLNFFIYSTINPKFRHSFRRLLGFRRSSRRQREKSWMLPPRDSSRYVKTLFEIFELYSNRGPAKCGCGFHKIVKSPLRKTSSAGPMNNRKISMQKPEIVIDEISPNRISISAGGNTTFRRSSDDCIRRSSSEIIGGITLPSQSSNDKRRGSGMSNSSASLHIHETRMTFEAMVNDQADCEIFV
ncbi:CBN-DOP-6 protein [Caenorhabditis brenneri]|uniref:CBN-DOP-6 protein n=1 Tax=Caenorhabditis brenneri TaxID=135651 RepID=G0M813_CAEBE|nr:CBN-DOP-6 protein [Caenorhabditis brenneri]